MAIVGAIAPRLNMRRKRTFRVRLTLGMTALCVGVLALASGSIYVGTRQFLLRSLDNSLLTIARTEIATLVDDPKGELHLHEDYPIPLNLSVGAGYEKLAQVQDADGTILGQTANLRSKAPLPSKPPKSASREISGIVFADLDRGGERYRAIYYPLHDPLGNPFTAVVALLQAPVDRALLMLVATLGLAMLVGGAAAAFGADRLAHQLTKPLEVVVDSVESVRDGDLTIRIPEISTDVELRTVATVLNEMLDRLESSFASQEQMIAAQRRFLGDASHELRSPLSNLRGTIEVTLRRPRVASEYREALNSAHAETVRMCRLVDDLLTLSRADAGQFNMEFAPCDLSYIVRQSAVAHATAASEADVTIYVDASTPKMVCGDRDRLRQVVDNLLDNALRYARGGSPIHLTTREDGQTAEILVRDRGPGIPPEQQKQIFNRFYRTDQARSRRSGGMGLGLAIAHAIIQAHRGRIEVESEMGEGAIFIVKLPAMAGDGT